METLNRLQRLPQWRHMAVFITYDDSDGWYDHTMPPIASHSQTSRDGLSGTGFCGTTLPKEYGGRCGLGPRLPFLVVSPWAKKNFVDHSTADQSSVLRFIEDNWRLGRLENSSDALAGRLNGMLNFDDGPREDRVFLDPATGLVRHHGEEDWEEQKGDALISAGVP